MHMRFDNIIFGTVHITQLLGEFSRSKKGNALFMVIGSNNDSKKFIVMRYLLYHIIFCIL